MIEGIGWKAAGFFFAVFSFIFGGIARVLWDMIKRQVKGVEDRLTQIEADIDDGRQSREDFAKQMAIMAENQARMEERIKAGPSARQIADLSREVGEITKAQEAMGNQVGLIVEHLIKPEGRS